MTAPEARIDPALLDMRTPEAIADPFSIFADLLDRGGIHWNESIKGWMVTSYADVVQGFRDMRLSSERVRVFGETQTRVPSEIADALAHQLSMWAVFSDPPTHTRLRKAMMKGFTPRAVKARVSAMQALVHELVDQAIDKGEMDMIADFAYPLPASVIADILGVPREDVDDLKRWSDDLGHFVLSSRLTDNKYAIAKASLDEMTAYFADHVARRRKAPGDLIIDGMIAAEGEGGLSAEELVASLVLLLFAGHETTTHFFANGLRALCAHPDQMADLCANLDNAALVTNAVHEMLRYDGPILTLTRIATEDIDWNGVHIREGDRVYLINSASGRDPAVFENPHVFDIRRPNANKQINFGYGIHLCLGITLARTEGEVAFPILLDRLRDIRLVDDRMMWIDNFITRGVERLPIQFQKAA